MKAITLRNIPPDVGNLIEREARDTGLSLNKAVLRLLRRAAGLAPRAAGKPPYHDLDHLAGTWSPEEADEFDRALAQQRRVEPELWS